MIALGKDHGGLVGTLVGGGLAAVVGETGALIVGVTLFIAGALLISGASAGALLRRSGSAVRRAGSAARRTLEPFEARTPEDEPSRPSCAPALRQAGRRRGGLPRPDRTEPARAQSRRRCSRTKPSDDPTEEDVDAPFDTAPTRGEYRLPDRDAAEDVAAGAWRRDRGQRPHRGGARPDAAALRRRGDDRGPDRRAARRALRAAARAGHQGLEGRSAEGRSLVRARDDGDPHPGADPRQAGGRCRGAEPRAEARHAG